MLLRSTTHPGYFRFIRLLKLWTGPNIYYYHLQASCFKGQTNKIAWFNRIIFHVRWTDVCLLVMLLIVYSRNKLEMSIFMNNIVMNVFHTSLSYFESAQFIRIIFDEKLIFLRYKNNCWLVWNVFKFMIHEEN